MSDAQVPQLAILDGAGGSVFTQGDRYEIPLYQRPYAWGERHIEQLIEDIRDIGDDATQRYYLGSLVVYPRGEHLYEVIDGQQRLTTLYLLLSVLGVGLQDDGAPALTFSCRDKSDYTLRHLREIACAGEVEDALVETNIARGLRVIADKLASDFPSDEDRQAFLDKLSRTCLYRIEVPAHTDLNHYFEIMNTRGEQLEQHEVLKAWLMEPLAGHDSTRFARIWDACSDMDCYVQMRFGVPKRQALFGWGFDQFPTSRRIWSVDWGSGDTEGSLGIKQIVAGERQGGEFGDEVSDEPSRFESIIDFRFFLLHVLKVFVQVKGIKAEDGGDLVPSQLDDKKLSATFEAVVHYGLWDGLPVDRERFSNEFAECLLQTRFLFDRCIVKREFTSGDLEGRWSLKELQRGNKNSHHYRNTRFKERYRERSTTSDRTNLTVLMLESCLRVSYTSPKTMHWITKLLVELIGDPNLAWSRRFAEKVEACAKDAVREYVAAGNFMMGVNTPHVVLNYLDYLLWCRSRPGDFTFEFRTSVEHWYPQNPSDDTFVPWNKVDRLGNLCLVQRTVNSKFSNLNPLAKKATFQEMIAKGSLKLREMATLTDSGSDWKDGACQQHEEEMVRLLREACGE